MPDTVTSIFSDTNSNSLILDDIETLPTVSSNTIIGNKIRVAINGFGRIGRQFFKVAFENPQIEFVAINDLGILDNLAYLLQYDSVYGKYNNKVEVIDNNLVVNGKKVAFYSETDPTKLPWQSLNIDIVVESTGVFTTTEKANAHIVAGAKRVVISAPAKDEVTPTSTPNINEQNLANSKITSNASCTTNATTPLAYILDNALGIEAAMLNTIHAYTATQLIVDGVSKKDYRGGRAAAQNIIPSTSGAAISVEQVVNNIKGRLDAMSMRVPVVAGSIVDFTFISKKPTTVEEVNAILKQASQKPEWKDIFTITEEQVVSSDILQNPHGSIADLGLTRVVNGNLVKVCAWYDNEWGYVNMMLKHIIKLAQYL